MLQKNSRYIPRTRYESLRDLNLVMLWSASDRDWSPVIREECLAATQQPLEEEEESDVIQKTAWLGILIILVFWGVAMWLLVSKVTQVAHEVTPKSVQSVEEVIFRSY